MPIAQTHPPSIGQYELLEPLGQGAMGQVYCARLTRPDGFEKLYAIKLMDLAGHDAHLALPRLLNEAVTGATFNHPNIVQVHDYGVEEVGGVRIGFVVMELLEGITFRDVIGRAREMGRSIPPQCVLDLALPIASALDYAWAQARDGRGKPVNMIHRDIKPTNLMVTRFGEVKLLDLGVVRASTNPNPTLVQSVKGTVPYMSPEQLTNAELDCRTDIFSLGLVIYELCLLRRLYNGDWDALRAAVAQGDVSAGLRAMHSYSPPLAQLLQRALQRDPDKRFQSPAELHTALSKLRARLPREPRLGDYLSEVVFGQLNSMATEVIGAKASGAPSEARVADVVPPTELFVRASGAAGFAALVPPTLVRPAPGEGRGGGPLVDAAALGGPDTVVIQPMGEALEAQEPTVHLQPDKAAQAPDVQTQPGSWAGRALGLLVAGLLLGGALAGLMLWLR